MDVIQTQQNDDGSWLRKKKKSWIWIKKLRIAGIWLNLIDENRIILLDMIVLFS